MSFTERPTITGWLVNRLTYGRSMYATSMAGNGSGVVVIVKISFGCFDPIL